LELIVAAVFLVATWFATDLYDNYLRYPILFVIPALAVVGLVLIRVFLSKEAYWKAWFASCLTIVSATFFGLGGLYPRLLPSSLTPEASLTIYNASSSPLTLKIMTGVALVFVPIVIAYQAWTYNLFKEKVREEDLSYEEAY
ncbi:MAG TPA: cytochrome d ubiquinol oxidase subunit II, partial [Thermodesulfatator sp.]|nr:cytochrome d ubiquinol oxidase subunit II [Thermodesulfatator sp.]